MQDTTSIFDEQWDGTEAEEVACFVTEVIIFPYHKWGWS
jgi:hypothetical protein